MSFTINDDVTLTSSAIIDNIRISSNTISSTNTDGHIFLAPNGNGTVQTDNLQFDGNTISSTDTNGHIVLSPNGIGNVGIGTRYPSDKLQITGSGGTLTLEGTGSGSHCYIQYYNDGRTNTRNGWIGYGSDGNVDLYITNENTGGDILMITPSNVGIGTSSPAAKLDIGGSATNGRALQLRSGDDFIATDSAQIIFSFNNGSYDNSGYAHSIRTRHNGSGPSGNAIDFWLWNQGVDTSSTLGSLRVMTLDGTGNVGIGTSSPAAKLDVAGTIRHQGLTLNEGTTPNVDEIKTFTKTLSVSTSWIDTGIVGTDLETGSYIIQVFSHNWALGQYNSTFTGFMSWFNTVTNSNYYNEVLLHSVGNDISNVLYIRTQLLLGNTNTLKLQIRLSGGSGSGDFTFKFRRMI